jgi:hypothetical protein
MTKLNKYNCAEMEIMATVRDRFKWFLGEELGYDPESRPESSVELELRFAYWITNGGGAWLNSIPEINEIINTPSGSFK